MIFSNTETLLKLNTSIEIFEIEKFAYFCWRKEVLVEQTSQDPNRIDDISRRSKEKQ